jgi:hypothetical protein
MMLTLLGVIAGVSMFALKKPLQKAIGDDV